MHLVLSTPESFWENCQLEQCLVRSLENLLDGFQRGFISDVFFPKVNNSTTKKVPFIAFQPTRLIVLTPSLSFHLWNQKLQICVWRSTSLTGSRRRRRRVIARIGSSILCSGTRELVTACKCFWNKQENLTRWHLFPWHYVPAKKSHWKDEVFWYFTGGIMPQVLFFSWDADRGGKCLRRTSRRKM